MFDQHHGEIGRAQGEYVLLELFGLAMVEARGWLVEQQPAAEQVPAIHPENPEIHTINQTLFAGPLERTADGLSSKNTVIVSPGRHDRSPCGTGTCARMAVLHARGELGIDERFIHRSLIGTEFIGRLRGTTELAGTPAVLPTITGPAWITAFHQYVLDPTDPLP